MKIVKQNFGLWFLILLFASCFMISCHTDLSEDVYSDTKEVSDEVLREQILKQLVKTRAGNGDALVEMGTTNATVSLVVKRAGDIRINWGDGTPVQTNVFTHTYTDGEAAHAIILHGAPNALLELNCNSQGLIILNIASCVSLKKISCRMNRIYHIDISNNLALTTFDALSNNLSYIDVSNNTHLDTLILNNNSELRSLNVTNNPNLLCLICGYTKISSLNLSNNPKLKVLACDNTLIDSLDISQQDSLIILSLTGNNLMYINFSPILNQLYQLNLTNTPIANIENNSMLQTIVNILPNRRLLSPPGSLGLGNQANKDLFVMPLYNKGWYIF